MFYVIISRSGQYLPDPTSDPAGSGFEPAPDTLDPAGSGSDPDPPNSPDIWPDPDLDPVHPYLTPDTEHYSSH